MAGECQRGGVDLRPVLQLALLLVKNRKHNYVLEFIIIFRIFQKSIRSDWVQSGSVLERDLAREWHG